MGVVRLSTGHWHVTFGQMARSGGQTDIALVTPADGAHCVIDNWGNNGADMDVVVRCYSIPSFAHADANFSVMMVRNTVLTGRTAFTYADQPSTASYIPQNNSYNSRPRAGCSRSSGGFVSREIDPPFASRRQPPCGADHYARRGQANARPSCRNSSVSSTCDAPHVSRPVLGADLGAGGVIVHVGGATPIPTHSSASTPLYAGTLYQ